MAFSTFNTFNGSLFNNISAVFNIYPWATSATSAAFIYYTCDTYNINSYLLNQDTQVYDGTLSNLSIISNVSPALGKSCLTMNTNYYVTLPFYKCSTSGFSVCFWFKSNTQTSNYARIIDYSNCVIFLLNNTMMISSGTSYNVVLYSNVTDNIWRNFSLVFNTNGSVLVYMNGIYSSTVTLSGYPLINSIGYIGRSSGSDPYIIASMDDIRIYDNKILSAIDVKSIYNNVYFLNVTNGNFNNPMGSGTYTYLSNNKVLNANTTLIPGWYITCSNDTATSIAISRSGSPFFPSGNSMLPSGYTGNYVQAFTVQTNNIAGAYSNLYQTLNLVSARTYTISFYASGRAGGYSTFNTFSVSLGSTTLVLNQSVTTSDWTKFSYTYNAVSTGSLLLMFTINTTAGANGDSTMNFANITVI